jgi:peptidoglycan/LPS O-acetylase OafA/YrhL
VTTPAAGNPQLAVEVPRFQPPSKAASVHLDALRGFAAFSVLLYHWQDAFFVGFSELQAPDHHNPLLRAANVLCSLGHQWVIVFFVLSGYLVGGSVLRSWSAKRWTWRGYLLDRLTRLYIVLLPALILGAVFDHIGMRLPGTEVVYGGQSGCSSLDFSVYKTAGLPVLLQNALFLQETGLPAMLGKPVANFGSNGPLWSLSYEFWYYIAFPFVVIVFAKQQSQKWRLASLLVLAIWACFAGRGILLNGAIWLMGVLILFLPPLPDAYRQTRRVAIGVAIALFGAAIVTAGQFKYRGSDLVLGVFVTALIWTLLFSNTEHLPDWYARLAKRASKSSYTLYLVHMPFLVFLKAALHLPRSQPSWPSLLVGVALLAIVVLYSQLIYELFEKNTVRLRNWLRPYVMEKTL